MKKIKTLLVLPLAFLIGGFVFSMYQNVPQPCFADSSMGSEFDEFYNYWTHDIRGQYPDICSMPKSKYDELYQKYVMLSSNTKAQINATIDVDNYTIRDTMKVLINKFGSTTQNTGTFTFSKDTTLTVIIVVGVLGMTSICGLYFMKEKNVIQ